jgi:hypothetical protein
MRNQDSSSVEHSLEAHGFFLDTNGDLYVNGLAAGSTLSHNSDGFFILKLDY